MAQDSNLGNFKEYELYPSLYERIDEAFPSLNFTKTSKGWTSKHHIADGVRDGQGKDITFVYPNSKFMAIDHTTGEKKGLIDLYMSLNGKDFITALKELAELCHLSLPNTDEWEDYEERQKNREEANDTFVKNLSGNSEEAKQVRSYLHARGWTDKQIRKAELGLITKAMLDFLPDGDSYRGVVKDKEGKVVGGIGTTHLLTIPYRNGARLLGFKFRNLLSRKECIEKYGVDVRYRNSRGLSKSMGLFGIGIGIKDVVIVEGELDALHARVMGAANVAATTGGQTTGEQIKDAVRRGAERFTLLFDNEERGRGFVRPTAEAIQKEGKSIYVASLPDGCKDLDEYLLSHTIEEYNKEVVGEATAYPLFVMGEIVRKYTAREEAEGGFTLKDREDFFSEVERLLNSDYTKPYEREDIYRSLEGYEDSLNFKVSDFREWADKDYLRKQARNRAEAVREASAKITAALAEGKTDEALKLMRETAATQGAQERAVEYAKVFAPSTPQDYSTFLSEIREGVPTGFVWEQGRQREELTLNPGLTFICGYRGHGKTSFLNNIALNEARRNVALRNGKSVLYFSYEVDKRRLIADLLNTFVNDPTLSRFPLDSILKYFKGKNFIKRERYDNFIRQKDIFLRDYLSSGALVVVEENYRVEKLLDAIKYYISSHDTSIVCVDYAQLIYSEEYSRQRTEEIKKVVNDIKDFANREGLPFVMAAQFNREVDSPISVDTKNIGEGGDFERIADTCIGLFNLKELHPIQNKDEEKAAKKLMEELGVAKYNLTDRLKPIPGVIFARLLKRRYGYYPLDTILGWEGSTKYIRPNFEEALSTQAKPTAAASDFLGMDLSDDGDAPF